MKKIIALLIVLSTAFSFVGAASVKKSDYTLNVSAENMSYDLSQTLYGLTLDDSSFATDGGLVSNLVNNSSFEYVGDPFLAWNVNAKEYSVRSEDDKMNENNKAYLSLTVDGTADVTNIGYPEIYNNKSYNFNKKRSETPDMGFKEDEVYAFSAYFKNIDFEGNVTVSIPSKDGEQKFKFNIDDCKEWKKVSLELESDVTVDGALTISFDGTGTLLMDCVSLVPKSSRGFGSAEWKYISLRSDLYDALAELSPKYIAFAGDVALSGDSLKNLFSWKNTIGPLEKRVGTVNHNFDGEDDYFNNYSIRMGYHEYFTLCSELGATPIPTVSAGIVRQSKDYAETFEQYDNGVLTEEKWQEYLDTIALRPNTPQWAEFMQDIFDLIEYANGDVSTTWGAKRAENGHPEPFNMKYIAIGNDNCGEVYWRNFEAIYNEIKAKYPDITLVAGSGEGIVGETFENAWTTANEKFRDIIVDEHYHTTNGYQFANTDRYDSYERSKASVMVGKYGASNRGLGSFTTRSNIWSALENAAFLTGLERNGDIVKMSSYAPVLAKINAQSNDVNMIWFDSQNVLLTPDYYLHTIFSNNFGTKYISTDFNEEKNGIYNSVTVDTENQVIYIKLVNSTRADKKIDINLSGFENLKKPTVQLMDETFKSACNEMGENLCVAPVEKELTIENNTITYDLGSLSAGVIRIPYGDNDGSALYELPEVGLISPYIHSAITIAIPCLLGLLIAVTVLSIIVVRIKNHREIAEETKEEKTEE